MQSSCPQWHHERKWRLTASRFGEIVSATDRRDMRKLYESMYVTHDLHRNGVIHGQVHGRQALEMFARKTGLGPVRAGLYINLEYPFLVATPDAIGPADYLMEIKCPYADRADYISPDPLFPCLKFSDAAQTRF